MAAIALYSDSAEDLHIVFYFFYFQETRKFPMNAHKLVVDRHVSGQFAQFAFDYATTCSCEFAEKNIPCPRVPFTYLMILMAASS